MSDPFSNLVEQLSSKGDWAVVLPVALIGFVADAVINIVPLPIFSPGTFGLISGGAALSVKRAIEALRQQRLDNKRMMVAQNEAMRLADNLDRAALPALADELRFEAKMTDDPAILIETIRRARAKL